MCGELTADQNTQYTQPMRHTSQICEQIMDSAGAIQLGKASSTLISQKHQQSKRQS
jgi:hypothetical protein